MFDNSKITISVPHTGGIHKSTVLSSLLKSDPYLSSDRLKRVTQCSKYQKQYGTFTTSNEIALFDDVAIYVKNERATLSYKVMRIKRTRSCNRALTEYSIPISIDDMDK